MAKPGEGRRLSGLPLAGDHHLAIIVCEAFQILSRDQHEPAPAMSTPPAHSFPSGHHLPKTGKTAEICSVSLRTSLAILTHSPACPEKRIPFN